MRIPELWRTTTFRLTTLYGLVFAVGVVTLLGLVYWRTTSALTQRVDRIVNTEASLLTQVSAEDLPARIRLDVGRQSLNAYGLFSADGVRIAGDVGRLAPRLRIDGGPQDVSPAEGFPTYARAVAERLPWGEVLVVGRDVSQIRQVRGFILDALVWSGALIAALGLAVGTALGVGPLHRLRELQAASHRIIAGDLATRMPVAGRRDELDLFAGTLNGMIDEVERLLVEVKSANDSVAHNLRTPLAHVRARLQRLLAEGGLAPAQMTAIDEAMAELDLTLDRFRAILRISEIEAKARRTGFRSVDLAQVARQVCELYEPLAEARGIRLVVASGQTPPIEADDKLLVEALSNLVDNAIKFSPGGGVVEIEAVEVEGVGAGGSAADCEVVLGVADGGPGIAPSERTAVLQRFRRGAAAGSTPGSGLGLAIVAAIARLHGCRLELDDNSPGLRATLRWPASLLGG